VFLRNQKTGERKPALGKHAEMLSKREAQILVKLSAERMAPEWRYEAEPLKRKGAKP
jgi:hypothetical protein